MPWRDPNATYTFTYMGKTITHKWIDPVEAYHAQCQKWREEIQAEYAATHQQPYKHPDPTKKRRSWAITIPSSYLLRTKGTPYTSTRAAALERTLSRYGTILKVKRKDGKRIMKYTGRDPRDLTENQRRNMPYYTTETQLRHLIGDELEYSDYM